MFLPSAYRKGRTCGLPRIRGGVSVFKSLLTVVVVFPAYAGVFLSLMDISTMSISLPRIRGGVSPMRHRRRPGRKSSPHTRGCFGTTLSGLCSQRVFPAYAGVFLVASGISAEIFCLPRIRGGVSAHRFRLRALVESSPHTRGCFPETHSSVARVKVFPAYAGVFLFS